MFSFWSNGWNSINYNEMYKANIAFDISPEFVVAQIGVSTITSSSCTMILEVHPMFFMITKDPATFSTNNDILNNAFLMEDVDLTNHSFDLDCQLITQRSNCWTKSNIVR